MILSSIRRCFTQVMTTTTSAKSDHQRCLDEFRTSRR
jgi:hypothetical protein